MSNGYCSKNKSGDVIKDFIYEGQVRTKGQIVKGCGCNIKAKTASESSVCPRGLW